MDIRFKTKYLIGISIGLFIILADVFLFWNNRWFWPIFIVAFSIGWLQFWIDFFAEVQRQQEIEHRFLDFIRDIIGSVKSGATIPQSILQASNESYGALTPFVKKVVFQMEWGISLHKALRTFAEDTKNSVIKRAIAIMIEAEESGGDIESVLESISTSVVTVKKMREEQKSEAYTQIVQGYIIFFVFIGIMLMLQVWLFPKLTQMSTSGVGFGNVLPFNTEGSVAGIEFDINPYFFGLLMIQGFFAGIMIGKFSEGTLKQGLVHSLALMTLGALIITIVKGGIN